MDAGWHTIRNRLARFALFILPLSLLLGESSPVKIGPLPIYWYEVAALLFLVFSWADIRKGGWQRLLSLPAIVRWGAVLLVPALMISTFAASVRHEALGAAVAWFIVPMLIAAAIIASGIEADALIFGVVVAALAQTLYGFQLLPLQQDARLMGTFTSPNFYAAVAVPAIFLSLLLPTQMKWLPIIVLLWGLLLSQSLGGFLGLIGGSVYLFFILVKNKKLRLGIAAVIILVGLVGVVVAKQRFMHNPRSSLASRQQIWTVAWKIGKAHPVTGVGLRNFDNVYLTTVPSVFPDPIEWNVPEPHNLYLAFWLDLSLLGLVAILLLVGGVLAQGGVAVAAIVALLAHGFVDTPIFKLELAVLFWLYIAIIFALHKGKKSQVKI